MCLTCIDVSVVGRVEATVSIKESKEEREERIRGEIIAAISQFSSGDEMVYNFPSTLNSYDRMLVHQVCMSVSLYALSLANSLLR